MPQQDFEHVLARLAEYEPDFSGSLWLHNYGEPLLDPKLPLKARTAVKHFPRSAVGIITTMGVPLPATYMPDLLDSGVKNIIVSLYSLNPSSYRSITQSEKFYTAVENTIIAASLSKQKPDVEVCVKTEMKGIREQNNWDLECPEHNSSVARLIRLISDGTLKKISGPDLHNFGNGRAFNPPLHGICRRIIAQNILQVLWDSRVISCCFDYDAQNVLGDLRSESLEEMYQSRRYQDFYQAHLRGDGSRFDTCRNCDMK